MMWRDWSPHKVLVYNGAAAVENSLEVLQKVKHWVIMWHSNSTPRYILKISKTCSQNNLYINVHNSIIYKSQKVETTQMSINWCTDKQNVVYSYNGILFSHKKKWNTDTCYNMDRPWKHYAKWKKPDTKGHILYHSIYRKCPE